MDAVELLSIIDIIKNEDLYNKKLQELREQQAKLADSRYMNLTIAKADQIRKDADKQLEEAKKVVEKAKADALEQDKKYDVRMQELERASKNRDALADQRVSAMKAKLNAVASLETKLKEWDGKLTEWDGRLEKKERDLTQRETKLAERVRKINEAMNG
jgi:chromosome segregation ATPase